MPHGNLSDLHTHLNGGSLLGDQRETLDVVELESAFIDKTSFLRRRLYDGSEPCGRLYASMTYVTYQQTEIGAHMVLH